MTRTRSTTAMPWPSHAAKTRRARSARIHAARLRRRGRRHTNRTPGRTDLT